MPLLTLIILVLFIVFCLWATAKYATGIWRTIFFVIIVAVCLYVLLSMIGVWDRLAAIRV